MPPPLVIGREQAVYGAFVGQVEANSEFFLEGLVTVLDLSCAEPP